MMRVAVFILGFMTVFIPVVMAWEREATEICEPKGVPLELVRAIVQVESSGNPNALNVNLGGQFRSFEPEFTRTSVVLLGDLLALTDRIDIGLMQVHYRLWGEVYHVSAVALLEVRTNLEVGCDILARELAGPGSLAVRIGRYHSRTPARNAAYARKVIYALSHPSS